MAHAHVMTPARRAALRRAQAASARARRKQGTKPAALQQNSHHTVSPQAAAVQQRAKRRRRTVVALGATAVAGGALGYSQARSPRSYTRTAAARHHYAREHAKMHYNLAQNAYAQTAKSKINRGQPVAPFPIKTTRRSTRKNARIAAAAYFPKGAVHKPKNMMRATKANVKVHKARVKAQKIRKRSPRRKGKR